MELRRALVRAAVSRPGVLLAVSPGATRQRLAVEAELARRGWVCVGGPTEADLFVILGDREGEDEAEGEGGEGDWVAALWQGIPAPKARVWVTDPGRVADALDSGLADLVRGEHGNDHAPDAPDAHHALHEHHEHHEHQQNGDHPTPPSDHGGHDMHGGHHGHAGHHMGLVEGLPMPDRADDRDGLRLDVLHVPLGPVLADWPAGLILRLTLQGDLVQEATVEPVTTPPSPHPPFWDEPWLRAASGEHISRGDAARRLCAAHLDSLGRFFAVAGWNDMAARTRHARDRALAGAAAAELTSLVRPLIRRAQRSRTLRWLTTGLGTLPAEQARQRGVTGPALVADGDAYNRMLVWLDAVGRSAADCDVTEALDPAEVVGPRGRLDTPVPPSKAMLDSLPKLLKGTEFACARIIVASLDPDLDELTHVPAPGTVHSHG
ncbi:hypothetical protein GCM10010306_024770 [Streptomyces umbrinus]|uniref:hypothetical protein n=1 Tax=Streptomyces umbrinus TaxID=67370 RepID=UPI001675DCD1|nr:hypothetical protein [Streptomyces umbrinus]GHB30985.1 hypothetical protein GCM10010306_024770 [Streptomyces umbrinus]